MGWISAALNALPKMALVALVAGVVAVVIAGAYTLFQAMAPAATDFGRILDYMGSTSPAADHWWWPITMVRYTGTGAYASWDINPALVLKAIGVALTGYYLTLWGYLVFRRFTDSST